MIAITVLFAPTSLVITTDAPPDLINLVERDSEGRMTRINLPDRLVIMANHQAYTDWMYLWILACYSGNSKGVVILLKAALKNIPIVGWGMVCHSLEPRILGASILDALMGLKLISLVEVLQIYLPKSIMGGRPGQFDQSSNRPR